MKEETKRQPAGQKCPKCGYKTLHQSGTPQRLDRLMRLIGGKPWRCHRCQVRFYRFFAKAKNQAPDEREEP
jgi:DNA-directed RNA polymerase subunit RPC12/RpoP